MSVDNLFPLNHQDLGHGTHLVDTLLHRPKLAACYLIQDGDEFALADCGTAHSVPQVLATLAALGGAPEQVRWIIPTHVHLDHAGGAGQLMQACPNATLLIHPKGQPHMIDPSKLQAGATAVYGEAAFKRDYDELLPIDSERTIAADAQHTVPLGQRQLRFIHTPGHANHHGVIFDEQSHYLFSGDTCGLGYQELNPGPTTLLATTTPVAFDPEAWMHSLDQIEALNAAAVCLTHFGLYPNPNALLDGLRASIQAHAALAVAEEANDSPGRPERLRAGVMQLLVAAAARGDVRPEQALPLLEGDIELNAQGLEVWLARRAKARARQ